MRIIRAFRLAEVTVITGFFLLGALLVLPTRPAIYAPDWLLYSVICWLYVLSGYSLNAWMGYRQDAVNRRLGALQMLPRAVFAWGALLGQLGAQLGMLLLLPDGWRFMAGSLLLGAVYSLPRVGLKYFAGAGTLVHVLTQTLHVCMAYAALMGAGQLPAYVWGFGLASGLFFGGGHLFHEVKDRAADKLAGSRTLAVQLGAAPTARLAMGLFALGHILLAALWVVGDLSPAIGIPFNAAFVVQLLLFGVLSQRGPAPAAHPAYFAYLYRALYLSAGLLAALALLWLHGPVSVVW